MMARYVQAEERKKIFDQTTTIIIIIIICIHSTYATDRLSQKCTDN